jgi:hydrogenase maturation protease
MCISSHILLIGIGNEYRGDDSIGLNVIRALKGRELPDTMLIESSGGGAELIEMLSSVRMAILIDAVSSGGKPGAIYRFDALRQTIPAQLSFPSTHVFGVAEAIELARVLGRLPPSLIVYAIEGENFSIGVGLSLKASEAVQKVVEQVSCEVQDVLEELRAEFPLEDDISLKVERTGADGQTHCIAQGYEESEAITAQLEGGVVHVDETPRAGALGGRSACTRDGSSCPPGTSADGGG